MKRHLVLKGLILGLADIFSGLTVFAVMTRF